MKGFAADGIRPLRSPSIIRRRTPAALAVGVHSFEAQSQFQSSWARVFRGVVSCGFLQRGTKAWRSFVQNGRRLNRTRRRDPHTGAGSLALRSPVRSNSAVLVRSLQRAGLCFWVRSKQSLFPLIRLTAASRHRDLSIVLAWTNLSGFVKSDCARSSEHGALFLGRSLTKSSASVLRCT